MSAALSRFVMELPATTGTGQNSTTQEREPILGNGCEVRPVRLASGLRSWAVLGHRMAFPSTCLPRALALDEWTRGVLHVTPASRFSGAAQADASGAGTFLCAFSSHGPTALSSGTTESWYADALLATETFELPPALRLLDLSVSSVVQAEMLSGSVDDAADDTDDVLEFADVRMPPRAIVSTRMVSGSLATLPRRAPEVVAFDAENFEADE